MTVSGTGDRCGATHVFHLSPTMASSRDILMGQEQCAGMILSLYAQVYTTINFIVYKDLFSLPFSFVMSQSLRKRKELRM